MAEPYVILGFNILDALETIFIASGIVVDNAPRAPTVALSFTNFLLDWLISSFFTGFVVVATSPDIGKDVYCCIIPLFFEVVGAFAFSDVRKFLTGLTIR